jgi:hypothetical protein
MQKAGKSGYTCASNEANHARHIWDRLDANGQKGAMACIVIPDFADAHLEQGGWQVLARWIDEALPYSSLHFFPKLWAVNVGWHEVPERRIDSYAMPKGGGETWDDRRRIRYERYPRKNSFIATAIGNVQSR